MKLTKDESGETVSLVPMVHSAKFGTEALARYRNFRLSAREKEYSTTTAYQPIALADVNLEEIDIQKNR